MLARFDGCRCLNVAQTKNFFKLGGVGRGGQRYVTRRGLLTARLSLSEMLRMEECFRRMLFKGGDMDGRSQLLGPCLRGL